MKLWEMTLGEMLDYQTERCPEKDFLVYSDRGLRFSYRVFNERVNALAKGLLSIGIQKGDHLGIWGTNVPDWLTFMFATAKIGVVLVTVNIHYKTHELEYVLNQSDMNTLCLIDGYRDGDYLGMVNELVPELKNCERGRLNAAKFPKLKNVVFIGQEKHRGMYNTAELILLGKSLPDSMLAEASAHLNCHDVINMQYTSGTTGFPKGVMLTHYNILNNGYYIGECQKFGSDERLCLPVPLFHCFGCVLGVMALYSHGGTLVMLESFDPLRVLASVQQERCTALYGVPTMFIAELNHPMFSIFDLSSLRTGIMAGTSCPEEVMRQVMEKMHCSEITIAYGLTENSPVMTQTRTDDPIDIRVSTVGKTLPGIEVTIRDPDTNRECPPDVPGEICCRGYSVMKGYYKMPEATASVIDQEGWLHSGDLGTCDAHGYFKVTGRLKDMIIRGGENVYPREVENFLLQIPEILNVEVVGVPSPKYGEEVVAFVILKPNAQLNPEDVRDFCRDKISRFKVPRYVFMVTEFPMTASGKIQKYKLREKAAELVAAMDYSNQ
ncbi:MAG: AMP-binding protein [Candidatus Delongbacteria bacterium]|nr:AMP-binding protein [Candidatus Delongbacteria bacterium]